MSVDPGHKLAGHMKRTELFVLVAARRPKSARATKRNKFKFSARRASIHGTTMRRVTTMNHLADIFNDGRTRM